uniref:Uncharacterized protein n=1 Tax=Mycena chlorophos TaxID=658473 RepID=A0ABQ0KWF9_MYCCL|nr:predicted protein [Mycena chlorophos]
MPRALEPRQHSRTPTFLYSRPRATPPVPLAPLRANPAPHTTARARRPTSRRVTPAVHAHTVSNASAQPTRLATSPGPRAANPQPQRRAPTFCHVHRDKPAPSAATSAVAPASRPSLTVNPPAAYPPPSSPTAPSTPAQTLTGPRKDELFVAAVIGGAVTRAFPTTPRSRAPKTVDTYAPSVFRPLLPAPMRLLGWSTTFGLSFIANHPHIPAEEQAKARAAIVNSLALASLSSYAAGPLRFTQFCDRIAVPEHLRMPAEPYLLCCWIADSIGSHGLSSAKGWLNGVAFWHHVNLAPWYGDEPGVKKTLRAIDKDKVFVRPPRPPLSISHLQCIRDNLDITTPFGAAQWALASAAL